MIVDADQINIVVFGTALQHTRDMDSMPVMYTNRSRRNGPLQCSQVLVPTLGTSVFDPF